MDARTLRRRDKPAVLTKLVGTSTDLITRIAHELRQPLTVISLLAEGLSQRPGNRTAASIQRDATRIAEQIDRINCIMLACNERTLNRSHTAINALIYEAMELVTMVMPSHKITVRLELADDLTLNIDKGQIEQILVNLFRNAIEAMQEQGGQLIVRSVRGPDRLEITVTDDGPGVSPSIRLFQPCVSSKKAGSGVGLAISRDIAEAHGGTLTVRPMAKKGSCFVIRLPLNCNNILT